MIEFPADFGSLEYNQDNKDRFLKAGAALLKSAAKQLTADGIIEASTISKNSAGIAVSGDVYGYFYAPGLQYGVLATLTGGSFAGVRQDRLICYLQYRTANRTTRQASRSKLPALQSIIGNNVYVDPIDALCITRTVERMLAHFPVTSEVA